MSQPPTAQAPRPLTELATWLIRSYSTEPGWDELHLFLRPLRDEVRFRVVVVRGEERTGRIGQLTPGNAPYDQTRALQDAEERPGRGTWLEAALVVAAEGWPQPTFQVTGRFNRSTDPAPWQEGEAPLDATDLVHHLTRYPRQREDVPQWALDRITAAGLDVPAGTPAEAAADVATEATQEPDAAIPVVVDLPSGDGEEGDPVPARPTDRPRPEALDIVIDRDGPVPADGTRPGRQRLRLGGSLRLVDVLETAGSPLPFLDDHGTWIVRHGARRDSGRILAVVEQGPGASAGSNPDATVHLLTNAEPVDLLDADDRLELYYCLVPGDLEVVLDSARLGEVGLPPAPSEPPNNEAVHEAVAAFAEEPGQTAMFHVLRQALGGRLVLDATGSELPEPGSKSATYQLATVTLPDGARGLGAFTSNDELLQFRKRTAGEDSPGKITGLAQSGAEVLRMFLGNENVDWLVVNPAGPSCPIGRSAAKFALSSPSTVAVKNLLAREHTAQELVSALSAEDTHLFLAQRKAANGQVGPAMLRDKNDDKPILLAFTSPAEIAAYNTEMGVLRLPAAAVLQLVLANRAKALLINPGGPRGLLSSAQVWHVLGRPEMPPALDPQPVPPAGEDSGAGAADGTEAPASENGTAAADGDTAAGATGSEGDGTSAGDAADRA